MARDLLRTGLGLGLGGSLNDSFDLPDTESTSAMELLSEAFGYGLDDLQWFTVNAMKSAFLPFPERLTLIDGVIKPGYAAARSAAQAAAG